MNGVIIINKKSGYTSHDIVYKIKKITGEKVGHTGTLDPLAKGVLPILVGEGTKISKYLINHDKIYKVKLKLGEKTSTGDLEGEVIEKENFNITLLDKEKIEKIFKESIGIQEQTPPIYSAIKVNGKKLYEYARKGQKVEIPKREINIYNLELISIDKEKLIIEFKVFCSKGTYIRSLCEDIAKKIETIGYMLELERLRVGEFDISSSVTIDELEKNKDNKEFLENNIISLEKIFEKNEKLDIPNQKLKHFLNGVKISNNCKDGVYRIYSESKFIGIGIVKDKLLKRDVII